MNNTSKLTFVFVFLGSISFANIFVSKMKNEIKEIAKYVKVSITFWRTISYCINSWDCALVKIWCLLSLGNSDNLYITFDNNNQCDFSQFSAGPNYPLNPKRHKWSRPMRPFNGFMNIHGLSNYYNLYYQTYSQA